MKNKSRESLLTISFTIFICFFLNRGTCFTFLIAPALFFSCIKPQEMARLKSSISSTEEVQTLDAFIFEPTGKLDCYQRIVKPGMSCEIASGSGPKQVLIIANSKRDKYDWAQIRSINTMADVYVELEDEQLDSPVMTSLFNINAGESANIDLIPLRSEIRVNSLRCDFSDKAYSNEPLSDIKIYLTHINASCSLLPEIGTNSSRFINTSMLDTGHLGQFTEPEMIMQKLGISIGNTTEQIQRSLYCYVNEPMEESIGSPITKLVIEGKIRGDTYYYPIKINPQGGGIARGCRYNFDIVLTRAGVTDPDEELEEGDIEIIMEVEKWKEKEGYSVVF